MTDFQRIDNALKDLGYARERGTGDHYVYVREEIPHKFVIPESLNHRGRAYKNTLAEIRRYEPGFLLGRPAASKSKKKTPEPSVLSDFQKFLRSLAAEEIEAYERYSYIVPGATVRYTSAEARGYARLDDPDSVMNIAYTVTRVSNGIGDCPEAADQKVFHDDDIVTVTDPQGNASKLRPSDLDPWELCRCCLCGRQMPENRFADEDAVPEALAPDVHGGDVCLTCCQRAESLVAETSQLDTPEALGAYYGRKKDESAGESAQSGTILDAVLWSRLAAVCPPSRTQLVKTHFRRPFGELDGTTREILFAPEKAAPERPGKQPKRQNPTDGAPSLLQVWKNACRNANGSGMAGGSGSIPASEGRVGDVPVLVLEGERCTDPSFQAAVSWLIRHYSGMGGGERMCLAELRCPNHPGQFLAPYGKTAELLDYIGKNGTKQAAGVKSMVLSAAASLPPLEQAQELYGTLLSAYPRFSEVHCPTVAFRWEKNGVAAMPLFAMMCTDMSGAAEDLVAICRETVSREGFEHTVFMISDSRSPDGAPKLVSAEEIVAGDDKAKAEASGSCALRQDDVVLMEAADGEDPLDIRFDDDSPLGGFSVRELMRELRRRGVEFTESGVNVPVVMKQNISFDEI